VVLLFENQNVAPMLHQNGFIKKLKVLQVTGLQHFAFREPCVK